MSNKCEFCGSTFSKSSNLKYHQKNTRYCLEKQMTKIKCLCGFEFMRNDKDSYSAHIQICFPYKLDMAEKENNRLLQLNEYLNKTIESQKEDIRILQNKLENIALQGVKKSTVTNTTTNNIVALQPLTTEWLNSQATLLSQEHVEKGIAGYAEFAKNHSLRNRVKLLDATRKKIEFLDENGDVVKDNRGNKISRLFFNSIQTRNDEILNTVQEEILRQVAETSSPLETSILLGKMTDLINISRGSKKVSKGESDAIKDEFVRELCNLLNKRIAIGE